MTIVPLRQSHVNDVARLHCAHLSGLVTMLGVRTARAFYTGCVRAGSATAFVATDEGVVKGFVLGSRNAGALRRDALRRNVLGSLLAIAIGLLRRPAALKWLLQSLRGPAQGSYDMRSAELIYLAVDRGARGAGVGRQLVEAFTRALRDAGVGTYELSVDADNPQAMAFYEGLGFRQVGEYHEFGIAHRRYRQDTTTAATPR